MAFCTANSQHMLKKISSVFPHLNKNATQSKVGKIAVIGGSYQFSGAPYYSAISGLLVGGDVSHIFCSKFSSSAIKSYAPDVITHPLFVSSEESKLSDLQQQKMFSEWSYKIKEWNSNIDAWIIGPGLGRDQYMFNFFPRIIKGLPDQCLLIIDADGIFYLDQHPYLYRELERFRTIITPNYKELTFLQNTYWIDPQVLLDKWNPKEDIMQLPGNRENPPFKLFIKGKIDIIMDRDRSFLVGTEGGCKRCGGLGDILAGATAACSLWDLSYGPPLAACLMRLATKSAFEREGRGMTAPSVIEELSNVVRKMQNLL